MNRKLELFTFQRRRVPWPNTHMKHLHSPRPQHGDMVVKGDAVQSVSVQIKHAVFGHWAILQQWRNVANLIVGDVKFDQLIGEIR